MEIQNLDTWLTSQDFFKDFIFYLQPLCCKSSFMKSVKIAIYNGVIVTSDIDSDQTFIGKIFAIVEWWNNWRLLARIVSFPPRNHGRLCAVIVVLQRMPCKKYLHAGEVCGKVFDNNAATVCWATIFFHMLSAITGIFMQDNAVTWIFPTDIILFAWFCVPLENRWKNRLEKRVGRVLLETTILEIVWLPLAAIILLNIYYNERKKGANRRCHVPGTTLCAFAYIY